MKKLICIALAVLLMFSMAACGGGGKSDDPNVGKWNAVSVSMMGVEMKASEAFKGGAVLELGANGNCTLTVDGEKGTGKWEYAGTSIKMTINKEAMTATVENGKLTITNVYDSGMDILFEKEGGYAGNTQDTGAPAAPEVGYWELVSMTTGGETYDAEVLAGAGISGHIEFREDGTFDISIGEPLSGTWKNGVLSYIDDEGDPVTNDYTIDKDTLTIDMGDGDNAVFGRIDESAGSGGANGAGTGVLSELQRYWNGTWYGVVTINDGTGKYEDGMSDTDMYMVVDIDAAGNGVFTVYDYELDVWGSGTCIAKKDVLEVVAGELEYSPDPMVPLDWTFFKVQGSNDKFVNTTDFKDFEGDTYNASIFFKPWGADWQDEIDFGRAGIYPPGYEDYMKKVSKGESSPFD